MALAPSFSLAFAGALRSIRLACILGSRAVELVETLCDADAQICTIYDKAHVLKFCMHDKSVQAIPRALSCEVALWGQS